jgi:hypothetical protein
MTADELRAALAAAVPDLSWLDDGVARVARDAAAIVRLFPRAARACGRAPLPTAPEWTADDAARVLLLTAVPAGAVAGQVDRLYRYGDANEKRAVLRALPFLPIGDTGVPLLHDALRTNDTRLVAAALGPYAVHLDPATWRQGVVKCVFMGIPLSAVYRLDDRADQQLAEMLGALATERAAAGRRMPADALALLNRLTVANTTRKQA